MVKRKRPQKELPDLIKDLEAQATFVRRSAIIELVERRALEASRQLEALLGDREAAIRACAAWALGELGEAAAVKPLSACLKDMDVDVRRAAAQSLAGLARPEAGPALQSASVDSDRWVAEWSRRGLARLSQAAGKRLRRRGLDNALPGAQPA